MILDHYGYGIGGYIPATVQGEKARFTKGSDLFWMAMALEEGMKAVGKAPPNPVVGCVFVKDGELLAKGATEDFGGRHGERVAASYLKAGEAKGATAYVSLEPCSHTGKQPPCAKLLVELGIRRCVIATGDPFPKVDGQGIEFLKSHGIEVELGVLAKEALAWHLPFLFYSHFHRPLMVAKWAQTFDGHLADDGGRSKWISGEEARAYTHFLRQKYDCIMVGSGTVLADIPRLDVRSCFGPINRSPVKVIIDPSGSLHQIDKPLRQRLRQGTFESGQSIYCGPKLPGSWLSELATVSQLELDSAINHEFLASLGDCYQAITQRSLQSIFVEGGPRLLNRLIEDDLIDVYHTFQRPSLLGASKNRIGAPAHGQGERQIGDKRDLFLLASIVLGQDLVVESLSQELANTIWHPMVKALSAGD